MKKWLVIGIFLLLVVYLNRAYARIFYTLQAGNLPDPTTHKPITITPDAPNGKHFTLVALGDSLTAGVGAERATESYPYILATRIASSTQEHVTVINLAVPGARVIDVITSQLPLVATLKPDAIVVLIGINDVHQGTPVATFNKEFTHLSEELSKIPAPTVVATIPFLGDSALFWPPYAPYFEWQTQSYNTVLLREVKKSMTILDLYTATKTHLAAINQPYSRDHFHPSASTYAWWSQLFYDSIYR